MVVYGILFGGMHPLDLFKNSQLAYKFSTFTIIYLYVSIIFQAIRK